MIAQVTKNFPNICVHFMSSEVRICFSGIEDDGTLDI